MLSFASGIIHTYYTVELAPPIAALVAIGTVVLWRNRAAQGARLGLAVGSIVTGLMTYALLHRTPSFHPWVGYLVVLASIAAAALVLVRAGAVGTRAGGGRVGGRRGDAGRWVGGVRPRHRRHRAHRLDPVGRADGAGRRWRSGRLPRRG